MVFGNHPKGMAPTQIFRQTPGGAVVFVQSFVGSRISLISTTKKAIFSMDPEVLGSSLSAVIGGTAYLTHARLERGSPQDPTRNHSPTGASSSSATCRGCVPRPCAASHRAAASGKETSRHSEVFGAGLCQKYSHQQSGKRG